MGLAWLHLARHEVDPPVAPARLIHLALHTPEDFFQGVTEDDLLPFGPTDPGGPGAIEAWDLHALIAAVERARIAVCVRPSDCATA